MNWYLAKLIFQVRSGEGTHTPQFDGQWRLIRADEVAWAYEKASVLGRLDESSFLNDRDETVAWKFIEVADIHLIGSLEDGVQLYSVTEEPMDANSYIEQIKLKSQKAFSLARNNEINSGRQTALSGLTPNRKPDLLLE
jgi:Domain of unknown function (DUF4288)